MTDYDNTNRGAIWKNQNKDEDWKPDFTGSLDVEGTEYFFDAWKRKPDASDKAPALSFKIKRKEKQPEKAATPEPMVADFDDSIPF